MKLEKLDEKEEEEQKGCMTGERGLIRFGKGCQMGGIAAFNSYNLFRIEERDMNRDAEM